jgi:hypothetical protein
LLPPYCACEFPQISVIKLVVPQVSFQAKTLRLKRSAKNRKQMGLLSIAKYFYPSGRNAFPLLNAIVAPSAQRSIIPKRPLRSGCFKSLSAIRTVALHYQQPNLLVVFSNNDLATNAFESLITNEHHYVVCHNSFLTKLIPANDYELRNHALAC